MILRSGGAPPTRCQPITRGPNSRGAELLGRLPRQRFNLCERPWASLRVDEPHNGTGNRRRTTGLDGVLIDTLAIPVWPCQGFHVPAMASSSGVSLVVWQQDNAETYRSDDSRILGIRINASNQLVDAQPFTICESCAVSPTSGVRVVGTQSGFFAAWSDARTGAGDIYGTAISAAGVVAVPEGVAIANDPYPEVTPALAVRPGTNEVLVVYGRLDRQEPYGSTRLAARLVVSEEGSGDAGIPDSGSPDAARSDAGTDAAGADGPDATADSDATVTDAATVDAEVVDASDSDSVGLDAGINGADGDLTDSGADAGGSAGATGCDCSVPRRGSGGLPALAALSLLGVAVRRRRQGR
jgi:hypothetical protein